MRALQCAANEAGRRRIGSDGGVLERVGVDYGDRWHSRQRRLYLQQQPLFSAKSASRFGCTPTDLWKYDSCSNNLDLCGRQPAFNARLIRELTIICSQCLSGRRFEVRREAFRTARALARSLPFTSRWTQLALMCGRQPSDPGNVDRAASNAAMTKDDGKSDAAARPRCVGCACVNVGCGVNANMDATVQQPSLTYREFSTMMFRRRFLVANALGLFALLFALIAVTPLRAAELDEALAHFTQDDFSETEEGITALAQSGDPRAATLLDALQDGRLLFSAEQKKVYYKNTTGGLFDAATGTAVAEVTWLSCVHRVASTDSWPALWNTTGICWPAPANTPGISLSGRTCNCG